MGETHEPRVIPAFQAVRKLWGCRIWVRVIQSCSDVDPICEPNTAHLAGNCRHQGEFLPGILEDLVSTNNPARVVDGFVDHLDLRVLGFSPVDGKKTGRGEPRESDHR